MNKENVQLKLSTLQHTWIIDLDGTLVLHNGYKSGHDELLHGTKEFIQSIPTNDYIIILTARPEEERVRTERFLLANGIRYNKIIFDIPFGERIVINDKKPSGLICAHSYSPDRNQGLKNLSIEIDGTL